MPYKSAAQERYFNANREKMEKQGVNVDEWNQASKGKSLPDRAGSKDVAHHGHQHLDGHAKKALGKAGHPGY